MNKKYCVVSNTYYINEYVCPYNIKYAFCGKSLEDAVSNLDFDFEFTQDFFKHIRFYEVVFNEKEQPIHLSYLKNDKDNIDLPNGWLSLNEYFDKINFHFSLFKKENQWYDSNVDLLKALLKWGKEVAKEAVQEKIVDSVIEEE